MQMDDPIRDVASEMISQWRGTSHDDILFDRQGRICHGITSSDFVGIIPDGEPRRVAFVDGGNGTLFQAPNYTLTLNQVCYSLFRGHYRVHPKGTDMVRFYACMMLDTPDHDADPAYTVRLFPRSAVEHEYLPPEDDLSDATSEAFMYDEHLNSLPRRLAELQMAARVIRDELDRGEILVMDGSLQARFKTEHRYAEMLYDEAIKKGVILCGLSKRSRLITRSGEPLLARIDEIARDVEHARWYVRVAESIADERGVILAVKLHPASEYVYRFEILDDQFQHMSKDEINSVLYGISANSNDLSLLGYPYGLVDADKRSQMRDVELDIMRNRLGSEFMKYPEWKRFAKGYVLYKMHDQLNRVSG